MSGEPRCACGAVMRYDKNTDSYACPLSLDSLGWGRPKKGHLHYVPAEIVDKPHLLKEDE